MASLWLHKDGLLQVASPTTTTIHRTDASRAMIVPRGIKISPNLRASEAWPIASPGTTITKVSTFGGPPPRVASPSAVWLAVCRTPNQLSLSASTLVCQHTPRWSGGNVVAEVGQRHLKSRHHNISQDFQPDILPGVGGKKLHCDYWTCAWTWQRRLGILERSLTVGMASAGTFSRREY